MSAPLSRGQNNQATLLAIESPEIKTFTFHFALVLFAGPVSFLCLTCSSQSGPCGGESYSPRTNAAPFP
eukprot:1136688-Pelagomonas_calceolata.AAC.15